jgi:hypothetical protein
MNYLNFNHLNTDVILQKLKNDGYFIQENVIPKDFFKSIQNFWINQSREIKKTNNIFTRGMINFVGQENEISFSKNKDDCFYRYHEFLWNDGISDESISLIKELNFFRNKILDINGDYGVSLNKDNYYLFMASLVYPNKTGCLSEHKDTKENKVVLHLYLPITFKNVHFEHGGLYIINKNNEKINLDEKASEGSIVFFNGAYRHGVDKVVSSHNNDRIALYPMCAKFFNRSGSSALMKKLFKAEMKIKEIFHKKKFESGLLAIDK